MEESAQEDVFGNPMMLSMLICYLQPSPDQTTGDREGDDTLTSVIKVAIDVMLRRVQSKQQADRHGVEDKVRDPLMLVSMHLMVLSIRI